MPPPPNQQDNDETAMNNVWLLWKPHEMMAILLGVPKKRNPQSFIEFLRTTISVYHADSRDLWVLVQQVLTAIEYTRF